MIIRLDLEGHRAISGTFSLLGVILSIILVFRTNSAYDRWWEGRKLWGALVNHSRNLAIQLDALLPTDDHATRASFARLIAGLRPRPERPPPRGGRSLGSHRRWRPTRMMMGRDSPPTHVPAHIARIIIRPHPGTPSFRRDRRIRPARHEAAYPGAARRGGGLRADSQDPDSRSPTASSSSSSSWPMPPSCPSGSCRNTATSPSPW